MTLAAPPSERAARRDGHATRTDIQGLRAAAVAAVLLFHFWPHRLTGGYVGVDVFLVISGFLITTHLLRHPIRSGRDLAGFWARRIRRLIPSACLVLAVTLVASVIWLPSTMLSRIAEEVLASALYVENWYLAWAATDYLAAEELHTPVQHYWSLSVEEQFYLLWPVLFAGIASLAAWFRRAAQWIPLAVTATVVLASLAYSVHLTAHDPAPAYFVSTTRFWELAAGGVLAVVLLHRPMRRAPVLRALMAWAGLALIGWTTVTYSPATAFPGAAAVIPVLGAVLLIAASADDVSGGPGRLLAGRFVQWLGDISYLVYLWHWPLLVITPFVLDRVLAWPDKLVLVALTLGLADVSKRILEDRVRWHPVLLRRLAPNFAVLAASLAVVVGMSAAVAGWTETELADAEAQADAERERLGTCYGAGAVRHPKECGEETQQLVDEPVAAREDLPFVYDRNCRNMPPYDTRWTCRFGAEEPTLRVALVGNSHAAHWVPTLEEVMSANPEAQVTTYLITVCYTVDLEIVRKREGDCQTINRWAIDEIVAGDYDLVVMSNRTEASIAGVPERDKADAAAEGYRDVLDEFVGSGAGVVVVRDTPYMVESVPDCIAAHDLEWGECTVPRGTSLERDPLAEVAAGRAGVEVADLTDYFCGDVCEPVVGGAIAFSDHGHLTTTFARTLAPEICDSMRAALRAGEIKCGGLRR